MKKVQFLSIFFLLSIFLSSCGSDAAVSSSPEVSTPLRLNFNARVVDGYIKGAEVCLDVNLNGVCNSTESVATTSASGAFSFVNIDTASGAYLSFISSGGVDIATNKPYLGELKSVVPADRVNSSSFAYVTPLTDLLATYLLAKNFSSTNYTQAKARISNAYTISSSYFDQNPMAYSGVFARSQEIQQTIGLLKEATMNVENSSLTVLEEEKLQKDIKNALLKQIMNEGTLNTSQTVTYLALARGISFSEYAKIYLDEQLKEIKLSIDKFVNTPNLTGNNLNNYQIALEEEADAIYLAMKSMDQNSSISVIPVNIDIAKILAIVPDSNSSDDNTSLPDNPDDNTSLPDSGTDPTAPVDTTVIISFGGYVSDGYISGSSVCIDLNNDGNCASGEPTVLTASNGSYVFSNIEVKKDAAIIIISSGGTDTAIDKARTSLLKNVIDTTSVESLNITPITDYIASYFLRASTQNLDALTSAQSELSIAFGISDLSLDPMQDVSIFVLSQELEYTLRILEKIFTTSDTLALQKKIKEALLTQILASTYSSYSLDRVITTLEIALGQGVSHKNREFALSQVSEIKRALASISPSDEIQIHTLVKLQQMLENTLFPALESLVYVDINATAQEVAYSDFSKTDALYDTRACISDAHFINVLSDSNTTSTSPVGFSEDSTNGILFYSNADEVKVYYPSLSKSLVSTNVTLFLDDVNYFSFDEAWAETSSSVYIQLPKNDGNKFSCYKAVLNSTLAGDIVMTKVFRYTDVDEVQ